MPGSFPLLQSDQEGGSGGEADNNPEGDFTDSPSHPVSIWRPTEKVPVRASGGLNGGLMV